MARIKEERDKRLFVAETFRAYETQCVKEEFEREKTQAETEFEVHTYTTIDRSVICIMYSSYGECTSHNPSLHINYTLVVIESVI